MDQRLSQLPPIRNNKQAIQDGGESTSRPSPQAIEPSLPPPIQDGGQQQQHGRQDNTSPLRNVPRLPPNFDASDPSHIAALHPEYRQPSLASHLTKTITTAITNGLGMPPPQQTCASTLTRAGPVHAPPAPTNTDATSQDVLQPTQTKSILSSPATERKGLNHLQALAVPPESTPEYLSHLTPPTPINIPQLAFYLQGYPNQATVHNLLDRFSQGFKIGYSGPRGPKEYSNLPCAKKNTSIIDTNMLKEVTLGHTAGPFHSPPFPNLQVYPIGAIPKKHSSEWRTIFHLSYPKHHPTSVNAHIPPEAYSLHYIKVDNAISILQELGQGCFMSKLDIKSAFRNIPVHPSDWELLGMKWEGLYFFDMVLPFGLRSAPFIFDQFSSPGFQGHGSSPSSR